MIAAGFMLATVTAGAVASDVSRMCVEPADCGAGGVCVSGLCRDGLERAMVAPLYRVAVPPPLVLGEQDWLREGADKLTAQLRRDLAWTGFYEVVPEEGLPTGWQQEGMSPSEMNRLMWQTAGVVRVLRVQVTPDRDPYTFRARLRLIEVERFDTVDLPEGDAVVRPGAWRAQSARFVDALVEQDTGLPGVLGTRLAVTVELKPGVKEIGVIDVDGGGLSMVTETGGLNLDPAWAPDGRIGYMSYGRGNASWVVEGRPLSSRPGMNAVGAWSPDGKYLALSVSAGDNADVVLLDGQTGEEEMRLTQHASLNTSPTWAPDGKRLAFISDRAGNPQVWIVDLKDGSLDRITGGYCGAPDWSPTGLSIVYNQMVGASFVIVRHDLDTGRGTRLTSASASSESPFFSPFGRYIAFVRKGPEGRGVWIMDSNGDRQRPLMPDGLQQVFAPAWFRAVTASGGKR